MKKATLKLGAKLKSKPTSTSNSVSTSKPKEAVWSLGAMDMLDDDIELLDDDTLLDHEEEKVVIPQTNVMEDCGTGVKSSRKPCKNCTCGRAEEYKKENDKKEEPKVYDAKKSSCGSCHLGDAFRCGGCPYLGMPAFDPDSDAVKLKL